MLRAAALLCLIATHAPAETLRLKVGIPTDIGDSTLTLTDVQDVRCPADVFCLWAGEIRLTLILTPPDGPAKTIILCNACDYATRQPVVNGAVLSLVSLDPSTADLAALGRPVTLADYTAQIGVSPAP